MERKTDELIDIEQVRGLFGNLDSKTQKLLMDAAEADLIEWSERLISTWEGGDKQSCQRARHSLKGLCGNFGASAMLALCSQDISGPETIETLRTCRTATLHALRQVACQ